MSDSDRISQPEDHNEIPTPTQAEAPSKFLSAKIPVRRSHRYKIAIACISGLLLLYVLTQPLAVNHLAIIKVISLAIAGLCAVLNHWKKRHDKDGNLDEAGKNIAILMIAGAFTAVGAAYIEESNKAAASLLAKNSMEQQLTQMQQVLALVQDQQQQGRQSLSYIERIVAPLSPPRVYAQFEVLLKTPGMASLNGYLKRSFPQMPDSLRKARSSSPQTNQVQQRPLKEPAPDYAPGGQGIMLSADGQNQPRRVE